MQESNGRFQEIISLSRIGIRTSSLEKLNLTFINKNNKVMKNFIDSLDEWLCNEMVLI